MVFQYPESRAAYHTRMVTSIKQANLRNMDVYRFPGRQIDRSDVVQRLIDKDQWKAARLARAFELGEALEF